MVTCWVPTVSAGSPLCPQQAGGTDGDLLGPHCVPWLEVPMVTCWVPTVSPGWRYRWWPAGSPLCPQQAGGTDGDLLGPTVSPGWRCRWWLAGCGYHSATARTWRLASWSFPCTPAGSPSSFCYLMIWSAAWRCWRPTSPWTTSGRYSPHSRYDRRWESPVFRFWEKFLEKVTGHEIPNIPRLCNSIGWIRKFAREHRRCLALPIRRSNSGILAIVGFQGEGITLWCRVIGSQMLVEIAFCTNTTTGSTFISMHQHINRQLKWTTVEVK